MLFFLTFPTMLQFIGFICFPSSLWDPLKPISPTSFRERESMEQYNLALLHLSYLIGQANLLAWNNSCRALWMGPSHKHLCIADTPWLFLIHHTNKENYDIYFYTVYVITWCKRIFVGRIKVDLEATDAMMVRTVGKISYRELKWNCHENWNNNWGGNNHVYYFFYPNWSDPVVLYH